MSVFGVQLTYWPTKRSRTPSPSKSANAADVPGAFRRVVEVTLAVVQEKADVVETRDHEVGKAVVVHVADGDAHAEERDCEPGVPRAVLEPDLAAGFRDVAVEGERGLPHRAAGIARPVAAVYEEKVDAAVAVRVERGHAGAHRLRHPLLSGGAVHVREHHARGFRHVLEADGGDDARGFGSGSGGDGLRLGLPAGGDEQAEGSGDEDEKISSNGHKTENVTPRPVSYTHLTLPTKR